MKKYNLVIKILDKPRYDFCELSSRLRTLNDIMILAGMDDVHVMETEGLHGDIAVGLFADTDDGWGRGPLLGYPSLELEEVKE